MPDMNTSLPDGRTATSADGQRRMVVRSGQWVNDSSYQPPAAKAKTATQDRTALNEASARAAAERDAQRTYAQAAKAVDEMGTGPVAARYLDAIVPDEGSGGGFFDRAADNFGAVLGAPLRALVSQRTLDARDHLQTVNANVALAGSAQMKGSSSDKDTALMRLSGIGPYKGVNENRRIIAEAEYKSGLEQARALVKANWIGKRGSLSQPAANGMTFEEALRVAEKSYDRTMRTRRLPKPPPSARRGRTVTIDLDGNPLND